MGEFKLIPISTLAGSTFANYFKVLQQGRVEPKYYLKIFLTLLVIIISTPFQWWEKLVFSRKVARFTFEKPPLFILGHWRSGTTMLHNMLCSDPEAGYVTTYNSLFPNNLGSKLIFKTFMKINTPEKRPSDNVKLDVDFPQEDEFAFSNMQHNAYYNFFYFPSGYQSFYDRAIHHKGLTEKEKKLWFNQYDKLLKKALINSKGKRLIVKNPVNTARIKHILKLYPDAKFLYIYRNPVTLFLSTRKFLKELLPSVQLQQTSEEFIEKTIFDVYRKLMNDYHEQRELISKENLYELRYESFEKHPDAEIRKIYTNLLKEDYNNAKEYFYDFYESIKGYKKNEYVIDKSSIDKIVSELDDFMKTMNYGLPEDIKIR